MAELSVTRGMLVAAVERPYKPFVNRETGETVGAGHTYWLWLVTDPASEPVAVKVGDPAVFEMVRSAAIGRVVACEVELFARGDKIQRRLVAAEVVEEAGAGRKG